MPVCLLSSKQLTVFRNWKTFDEESMDFCQGITLHHLPGHTDGALTTVHVASASLTAQA